MRVAKSVITYRGAVEGKQEILYFEHLQNLINESSTFKRRVNFKFKDSNGGSPSDIVKTARIYSSMENTIVAVFDYDFKDKDFINAINTCDKNNIIFAFSIPNFDLFLILHKELCYKQIISKDNYEKDLKKVFNLDNDCDIKSEETIKKILSQITLDDVKNALRNATIINKRSKENNKIITKDVYEQPYLSINYFIEKVFDEINS